MTQSKAQLCVLGGGPGGYAAAFLAADLGLEVTLIDREVDPGGVCLYRGCIPSKALLHAARLIGETRHAASWGIHFSEPRIDLDKLREWKSAVVKRLTGGLGQLSKQRAISYVRGQGTLLDGRRLQVAGEAGTTEIAFEHAILATGSRPARIPSLWIDSPRVLDSSSALDIESIPKTLLVIGGGYIGLELGSVYAALGSAVTVVEMTPGLLPGADRDLVTVLARRLEKMFTAILLETRVVEMREEPGGIKVRLEGAGVGEPEQVFEKVLVAVGRKPNSDIPGLGNTAVEIDARGFIKVDGQRRTAEPRLFAIGDVAGEPMLAHKASHEGRVAAEVIAGHAAVFEPRAIPAVVFTDPEIAWCGLTETQAAAEGRNVTIARFPWPASGRAITLDRPEGVTKLVIDPETERVLGVGIAGAGAGELIAEGTLAIEMGATAKDLALTIHAHPTLSETMMESAEAFFGQATHIYRRKAVRK
jgi:dihydrolipoamide dehydrogenase